MSMSREKLTAPTLTTSARISAFRDERRLTQAHLAKVLGVTQGRVAQWEKAGGEKNKPSPMACIALSKVDLKMRDWWIRQAGSHHQVVAETVGAYKKRGAFVDEDRIVVPILTAVIAAGQPADAGYTRDEYEGTIALPIKEGLQETHALQAAYVTGESMRPRIEPGDIIVVNTRIIGPGENVGHIVAARGPEGVTVKRLERDGDDFFLVAENPAFRPTSAKINAGNPWQIAGRVVAWVCLAKNGK